MKINDFSRVIWKKGKENLSSNLYKSVELLSKCEYKTVTNGLRTASTLSVTFDNLPLMLEEINNDGLIFTPCKKTKFHDGFVNIGKEANDGEPYMWFGCVTKTVEDSELFKNAYTKSDHSSLGDILGYPLCCVEYFNSNFDNNYDPIFLETNEIINGNPVINILLKPFGPRIISHLPCSPHCERSIEIGNERVDLMRSIDRKTTDWLVDYLSSKMTWDSYHGIIEVDTTNFLGLTNGFPIMDKPRVIKWNH